MKKLALASLLTSLAAAPTPVPQRAPASAMKATMNFLIGAWDCGETVGGRRRSSHHAYRWSNDGHWLTVTEVSPPFDRYRKTTYAMEVRYTFDNAKQKWVEITTDNTGYYGLSYARPWKNGRLVTRDILNKDTQLTQDILVRVSARQTTDAFTGLSFKMKPNGVTYIKKY